MTSSELTKSRKYKPQQIETALQLLAATGSPTMVENELGINEALIRHWRDKLYPERYHEIREHIAPKLEAQAIEQARHFIVKAGRKQLEGLDSIDFQAMDQKDRAGALRNVATASALAVDKHLMPLTGRPSTITEHRTPEDIVAALSRLAPKSVPNLDGTAEDITDQHAVSSGPVAKRAPVSASS